MTITASRAHFGFTACSYERTPNGLPRTTLRGHGFIARSSLEASGALGDVDEPLESPGLTVLWASPDDAVRSRRESPLPCTRRLQVTWYLLHGLVTGVQSPWYAPHIPMREETLFGDDESLEAMLVRSPYGPPGELVVRTRYLREPRVEPIEVWDTTSDAAGFDFARLRTYPETLRLRRAMRTPPVPAE